MIFRPDKGISITTSESLHKTSAFACCEVFRYLKSQSRTEPGTSHTSEAVLHTEQGGMETFLIKQIEHLLVTAMSLKEATQNDPLLTKVLHFTLNG